MATDENAPGGETGGAEDEHAGGRNVTSSLRQSVVMAAEMLAQAADRERAIADAMWSAGYSAGFGAGCEVGERRVQSAALLAHDDLVADLMGRRPSPAYRELELIRWDGRREDFGKPRPGDHPGGPKPWNGPVVDEGTAA